MSPYEDCSPGGAGTAGERRAIVEGVIGRDPKAMLALYRLLLGRIGYLMTRRLPCTALLDRVHDAFVIVVEALDRHALHDPNCLNGFVQTIVSRQHVGKWRQRQREGIVVLEDNIFRDKCSDPEAAALEMQRRELLKQGLGQLRSREREILERFYFSGQSEAEVEAAMGLTTTQFRLLKSRSKAKLSKECIVRT